MAAYRATSGRAVAAQEVDARQMARQLASQQRLAQEATRELAQVSMNTYMHLLDSVFSFYQGAPRGPRGAPRRPRGARAKPRAGEVTKRATRRPTPQANRRASGYGPPGGRRSGDGAPDLETGPLEDEGRVRLPSDDDEGAETAARRSVRPRNGSAQGPSLGGSQTFLGRSPKSGCSVPHTGMPNFVLGRVEAEPRHTGDHYLWWWRIDMHARGCTVVDAAP
jgi:hypothetical protein